MSAGKHTMGPSIVIVGAGIGGLSMGIALKEQLGYDNFTIYEKAGDVGGTWRDNVYPGSASDIATHFYSLSTELNPYWSKSVVPQAELQTYWKGLTEKHDLYNYVVCHTKVISAEWDAARQLYDVVIEDVRTGERKVVQAHVLIAAIGILSEPSYPPDLSSISTFKGQHFHSARWDHSVELRGKRVAVIGNGCSAAQFVPCISEEPTTHVVNFCRTPAWFVPVERPLYSDTRKWLYAHVPVIMRLHRWALMLRHEMMYVAVTRGSNNMLRRQVMRLLTKYMKNAAPKEYADKLIPQYPIGCKRMIADTKYLDALHRPNLDLNWEGIDEIVENGVRTKNGEVIPFDVIILATGFLTEEFPILLRGREGKSIQDYFREQQGPTAYMGTAAPGFPNFYMIQGPNTTTVHSSVIFSEEVQINYILNLIRPLLPSSHPTHPYPHLQLTSLEVTSTATDTYNTALQGRLSRAVWAQCSSWYRAGPDRQGKTFGIWPGSMVEFWWRMRRVRWEDWVGWVREEGEDGSGGAEGGGVKGVSGEAVRRMVQGRGWGAWGSVGAVVGLAGVVGLALWVLQSRNKLEGVTVELEAVKGWWEVMRQKVLA